MRKGLLELDDYLTVLSSSTLHFAGAGADLAVLPIDLSAQTRPIGIMTLKDRRRNPVLREMIEAARAVTTVLREHAQAI